MRCHKLNFIWKINNIFYCNNLHYLKHWEYNVQYQFVSKQMYNYLWLWSAKSLRHCAHRIRRCWPLWRRTPVASRERPAVDHCALAHGPSSNTWIVRSRHRRLPSPRRDRPGRSRRHRFGSRRGTTRPRNRRACRAGRRSAVCLATTRATTFCRRSDRRLRSRARCSRRPPAALWCTGWSTGPREPWTSAPDRPCPWRWTADGSCTAADVTTPVGSRPARFRVDPAIGRRRRPPPPSRVRWRSSAWRISVVRANRERTDYTPFAATGRVRRRTVCVVVGIARENYW